nr:NAD(P)-binding domain-containing protein [uncultured Devosia sp.]
MTQAVDVLVIGAGQAGLAAGYWLAQAPVTFAIVDGAERIGSSWRRRYDGLTLFTPRSISALPGMALEGNPEGYATGAEFADYLEQYAIRFGLPVSTATEIVRLSRAASGHFVAENLDGKSITARSVIDATGAFQTPAIPRQASEFSEQTVQLTVDSYRNPGHVPPGSVLVVGDGASGRDIAVELARSHKVTLATGKRRRLFPERLLGRNTWWWLDRTGLLHASATSLAGRAMRQVDPFPDRGRNLGALRGAGIDIKPRLSASLGGQAVFEDGSRARYDTVIWAVGYREIRTWVDDGAAAGVTRLGRPWQTNRASALIAGAGRDARRVVHAVLGDLRDTTS